jgi:hypothetical protein
VGVGVATGAGVAVGGGADGGFGFGIGVGRAVGLGVTRGAIVGVGAGVAPAAVGLAVGTGVGSIGGELESSGSSGWTARPLAGGSIDALMPGRPVSPRTSPPAPRGTTATTMASTTRTRIARMAASLR